MLLVRLLTFLMIFLCSCKSDNKYGGGIEKSSNHKEISAEGLGDIFAFYHASPASLIEADENALIETISDKGYPVVRTENGVFIYTLQVGTGSLIQNGQALEAHYVGKFLDGQTFQSSYDAGKPLSFRQGQMVSGWNEALLQMRVGDRAILFIPSHLAYGEQGRGSVIPANANLIFEVEILP